MPLVDVVLGQGEVGRPLRDLLASRKEHNIVGVDLDPKLNVGVFRPEDEVELLHICYGFLDQQKFIDSVVFSCERYNPVALVIHSTVKPYTTKKIQEQLLIPVIYSPVRGLHKQMGSDMKTYTKFYALYKHLYDWQAITRFVNRFESVGVQVQRASTPHLLEYAKILVDTTYYGWLISFAQRTNQVCVSEGMDYDELWSFAEEIHKVRGDRPKMFPGFIGGHCVIPNLKLLDGNLFHAILLSNDRYRIFLEVAKET